MKVERRIWRLSWPELAEATLERDLAILPVGVVEAHGPHLPLGTDFIIPTWLAERLADELDAMIAPTIPYGNVESLSGYVGSMSIGPDVLEGLVYDVVRSLAESGFSRIILLNGHGGSRHLDALKSAIRRAWRDLGVKTVLVNWWILGSEAAREVLGSVGGHAGTEETAAIMVVDPSLVKRSLFDRSEVYLYEEGIDPYPSPGSILLYSGDDRAELPDEGAAEAFMERLVSDLSEKIRRILMGWDGQEGAGWELSRD